MSVLLIKTDPIYFYLNNDTKDYPQQNKFVIVDVIQCVAQIGIHKHLFIFLIQTPNFILNNMYCFKFGKISF